MNKYEVIKTIGEGAYGVVLQCRNKETGELVAIKRFKESDEDELVRKTSLREVRILRLLKDEPYVVRLQEAFRRKGKLYLVFDYVGCNLLDVLEQSPQGLPMDDVRRMVFTMLLGVKACHVNGVIHRDIKPENLLVHNDNTLRLCDFGFARIYSSDMKDLTDYVATRWYRSPELLLGTTDYGLPSDMWAVGCIMAELIDGQAIFPCETEVDQIFVVQKLLGNYTQQQSEVFKRNPRFQGYTLKDISRPETTLERKFGKKANKKAISLLKSLLVIDPSKRVSVDEAILHPFFEGLIEVYHPQAKNVTPLIRPASSVANRGRTEPQAPTVMKGRGDTPTDADHDDDDGSLPKSSTTLPPARLGSASRQIPLTTDPMAPRVTTPAVSHANFPSGQRPSGRLSASNQGGSSGGLPRLNIASTTAGLPMGMSSNASQGSVYSSGSNPYYATPSTGFMPSPHTNFPPQVSAPPSTNYYNSGVYATRQPSGFFGSQNAIVNGGQLPPRSVQEAVVKPPHTIGNNLPYRQRGQL